MNVNDLTLDIVKSYANACRELHDHIEVLKAEGYDLLVVPSRGAHPFLDGARSYAHKLRDAKYDNFSIPRLHYIDELYLPFTADIGPDVAVSTVQIRRFWCRTLAAILKHDSDDAAYRFYRYLRGMGGDLAIGSAEVRDRVSGKFIFVDTVQSGQAIAEICAAFATYGLTDCHFLLLVDEGGRRIKSEYAVVINQMTAQQQATIIHVDKIFTEDEGPAMSGIWTVTFPDLMQAALQRVPEFANGQEAAATLYYHEVSQRADSSNKAITISNAMLGTLLFSAVRDNDQVTSRFLERFQRHVDEEKLQRQEFTRQTALPLIQRNLPISSTTVSGSHVIRAQFNTGKADALVADFLRRK